jgi:hypothetical protein
MATHTVKADWLTIDPATLSETQRKMYDTYKTCYKVMKQARADFEQAMQEGVPEGERMICGYNFGKLSVAIVPDERKPVAAAKGVVSLAAFLAQRKEQGLRI